MSDTPFTPLPFKYKEHDMPINAWGVVHVKMAIDNLAEAATAEELSQALHLLGDQIARGRVLTAPKITVNQETNTIEIMLQLQLHT